ncbi:unnamed protein product [Protopolystoma xenopodis]|uniref:Uncharacterized protein n=1 Tax=Protopolystoma xenopodis TaxID=117903 RepID=A0A3S5FGT8_9PLAT|nr:unnamed protein product [Protopolystoma xenopodis]
MDTSTLNCTWQLMRQHLRRPRNGHSAAAIGSCIYAIGGSWEEKTVERLDTSDPVGVWLFVAEMLNE